MTRRQSCFWKYVRHDLHCGIFNQWPKYGVIATVLVWMCLMQFRGVQLMQQLAEEGVVVQATAGDYIANLLRGMEPFNPENIQFTVNILWLFINLYLAYIVSFYPFKDLQGYGQQMLLRAQNRVQWWLCKCIWNILSVLTFYFVLYACAVAVALLTGAQLQILPGVTGAVRFENAADVWMQMVLCPVLVSVGISMLQMLIALLFKPLFGILGVCFILVLSIFTNSSFAPGNHLMMLRVARLDIWPGLLLSFLFIAASISIGAVYFRKKDLFGS